MRTSPIGQTRYALSLTERKELRHVSLLSGFCVSMSGLTLSTLDIGDDVSSDYWVQILGLPLPSCVKLSKLLNFSVTQFSYL